MKPRPPVADKRPRKPVTAQPIGQKFAVITRGLESHRKGRVESENFGDMGNGCYRRLPTSRE